MEFNRDAFEHLDDDQLLCNLAFFAAEYAPGALKMLMELGESRGITEERV